MSNQYVLVDFENVQPDLSTLANTPYKVKIFFGAKQQESRVPFKLLDAVMALGGNAESIKITRSGSNAVDMHIAWYVGGLLEREPDAHIHIISGDTDFDPLIEFLKARGVQCRRSKTITDLVAKPARTPAPRAAKARAANPAPKGASPAKLPAPDTLAGVLKQLRGMNGKPTTRKKLAACIDAYNKHHGGAQSARAVEQTIVALIAQGFVTESGTKVGYTDKL